MSDIETHVTADEVAHHLVEGSRRILSNPSFAHHLSKAAAERWLAFELAAFLDKVLERREWISLVERGATKEFGNIDLLVVPASKTDHRKHLGPRLSPWPSEAIAIEIKAAHLGDGDQGVESALASDLTEKPVKARKAGRHCAAWLGVLLTTSGLWEHSPNADATREREDKMKQGEFNRLLTRFPARAERELRYLTWSGWAWVDVFFAPPA
jgi:hypothetical protein